MNDAPCICQLSANGHDYGLVIVAGNYVWDANVPEQGLDALAQIAGQALRDADILVPRVRYYMPEGMDETASERFVDRVHACIERGYQGYEA